MFQHIVPQPSTLDEALAVIAQLRAELSTAHTDPIWGIASRQGIERRMQHCTKGYAIVVGDLDYLHEANERYGHEGVDARVRAALQVRAGDFYLGRWKRGDELIALVADDDAKGLAERLRAALQSQGLSATFAIVRGSDRYAAQAGLARIEEAKRAGQRGRIFEVKVGWA